MAPALRTAIFIQVLLVGSVLQAQPLTLGYPVERILYVPGSYAGRTFYGNKVHLGEDIKLPEGTAIRAIAAGKIIHYGYAGGYADSNDGTSIAVVIEHDLGQDVTLQLSVGHPKAVTVRRICSIYGHVRKSETYSGHRLGWASGHLVSRGDIIGYVNDDAHNGQGEEHLHLGIRLGGHPGHWAYYGNQDTVVYPESNVVNFAAASEVIQRLGLPLRVIDFWQKNGNGQYSILCYGDEFLDAQFKIANDGAVAVSLDRVALAVHRGDGTHLLDVRTEGSVTIPPGSVYHFQRSWLAGVHEGLVRGNYKLVAKVFHQEWITLATLDFGIQSRSNAPCGGGSANLPDLVVTAFSAPTSGRAGSNLTGTWIFIENRGTADTGPFQVGYFYSRNRNVTAADIDSGWWCPLPAGLAAGETNWCSGDIGVPASLSPGTYYLAAIIDSRNEVRESDESNNSRNSDDGPVVVSSAADARPVAAEITAPPPGSTLAGTTVTFTWTSGRRITGYYLRVGTAVNGRDIYDQNQGAALSRSVSGLPTDGRTLYVRLFSHADDGDWYVHDYTYQAASIRGGPAAFPESPHPYPDDFDQTWSYTHSSSGTTALEATFDARTEVEADYDYIHVMDGQSRPIAGSPFTGTYLAGRTVRVPGSTLKIRLTSDGSIAYWGFRVTSVVSATGAPPPASRRTVFLIHGLSQQASDMDALGATLRDPDFGLDRDRFGIDVGFDYSDCANNRECGSDCTIQSIARRLARYINQRNPTGDIVLIGYSLGGLVARDMMLNNYEGVFDHRRVGALVTLGTPNVGYPYSWIDELAKCPALLQQMNSDFRSRQSEHLVLQSGYLYDLNNNWGNTSFIGQPRAWLAAAGTFCKDATRDLDPAQGCPDHSPASDGVVCDQSARFRLNVPGNKPTKDWQDSNYAHTESGSSWLVLCGNWAARHHTLFNPPASGSLVRALREVIHGQ